MFDFREKEDDQLAQVVIENENLGKRVRNLTLQVQALQKQRDSLLKRLQSASERIRDLEKNLSDKTTGLELLKAENERISIETQTFKENDGYSVAEDPNYQINRFQYEKLEKETIQLKL